MVLALLPRVSAQQDTTELNLSGMAAFRPGDDPVWRSKYIDEENGWNFVTVPGAWEDNGYPVLDGFGWYRIRFRLPDSMRTDSLVLLIRGIDDADETFLNGIMVGKSGDFPPNQRSELYSLRAYPLPKALLEEYNLLAIRVCDFGEKGGIAGDMIRIVPVDRVAEILNQTVEEPFRAPLLFTSNGVSVSAYNPVTATIEWMKPHLFSELQANLTTETVLSSVTLSVALDGYVHRLKEYEIDFTEYFENTNIIRTRFTEGFEVLWYHPEKTNQQVLVGMLKHPKDVNIEDVGLLFSADKNYWQYRDFVQDIGGERRYYFVLVYHSCCDDLALRDLRAVVGEAGRESINDISLERQLLEWKQIVSRMFVLPPHLTPEEKNVYMQSVALLHMAQVRSDGAGDGQIVSAFSPASRAYTVPREHLVSIQALATAGLLEEAARGFKFLENSATGKFMFFDVYGEEFGAGLPYFITPSKYYGSGMEYTWKKPEESVLSYDGMAIYIETIQKLQDASRKLFEQEGSRFNDSIFVHTYWNQLSRFTADVLMHVRDSSGFIKRDGGPFGSGLDLNAGIYSSIHASAALHIASGYAELMHDETRHTAYEEAALDIRRRLDKIIKSTAASIAESSLTVIERNLFHPLLIDGLTMQVFPPRGQVARFALEMMEKGFSIEKAKSMYSAQPDGDWFARQARPLLTIRLARAYAADKQLPRANELFKTVTDIASEHYGMIPEFIAVDSGNWYGGVPAIGYGAAEYVLAAWELSRLRQEKNP